MSPSSVTLSANDIVPSTVAFPFTRRLPLTLASPPTLSTWPASLGSMTTFADELPIAKVVAFSQTLAPTLIVDPNALTTMPPVCRPAGVIFALEIELTRLTVGLLATVLLPTVILPPETFIDGMSVLPVIFNPAASRVTLDATST